MGNGRILHLAINEKFIDYAHISFENVAPGKNDYLIFVDEAESYVRYAPHRVVRYRDRYGGKLVKKISAYDFVVVHSLHPYWISVINACRQDVVFVWVGWGYDYYDIISPDPSRLLLGLTQQYQLNVTSSASREGPGLHWRYWLKVCMDALLLNSSKVAAIERIKLFSPVLPSEYRMVRESFNGGAFPAQAEWNYGSLEEVWLRDFGDRRISGANVLLGNSASYTSNHIDILQWLADSSAVSEGRQVVCPLSYGDESYAAGVCDFARGLKSLEFRPILDFMPLPEYVGLLASCSHVILNHVRQQGVGLLVIVLSLGARVFLRAENPVYEYLRDWGIAVNSIQELQSQPELLSQPLDAASQLENRRLLGQHWSKESIDRKTARLIERAQALAAARHAA